MYYSSSLTQLDYGQELVILHTTPSMYSKYLVHAWRQHRGLNEGMLYIHSLRVYLSLACHEMLKLSLALNEPKQVALHSILNTTSEHAPQVEKKY